MTQAVKVLNVHDEDIRTVLGFLMIEMAEQTRFKGDISCEIAAGLLEPEQQIGLLAAILEVEWLRERERHHAVDRLIVFDDFSKTDSERLEIVVDRHFLKLSQRLHPLDRWSFVARLLGLRPLAGQDEDAWIEATREGLLLRWQRLVQRVRHANG